MKRRRWWTGALGLLTVVLALALGWQTHRSSAGQQPGQLLFAPVFGASGLVTNELAFREPDRPGAHLSPDWWVTSGSLFADHGTGWSGRIDDRSPDVDSLRGTDSAVLRAVSRRTDLGNSSLQVELNLSHLTETLRTGRRDFDGLHLMARYRNPDTLYYVSVCRRDGVLAIKKKVPRIGGVAEYTTLAHGLLPCPREVWRTVRIDVRNTAEGVLLSLVIDGRLRLTALDHGQDGTAPLTSAGRVGVRGDNAEFHLRALTVRALG